MTLAPTLELATHFVKPGGAAFLWKGSRREEEMGTDQAWQADWELEGLLGIGSVWGYALPLISQYFGAYSLRTKLAGEALNAGSMSLTTTSASSVNWLVVS